MEFRNVTKRYGSLVAVDDVSLDIYNDEFLTLLGPSGAGKTTLLHMIAGFVEPTDGQIRIQQRDVTGRAPYERDFGLVFQNLALFPHMSVRDNIAFPLKMRRRNLNEIDEKIDEVLDLVRLPRSYKDSSIDELSGGQQQRVAIARAIVYEPPLLLLDEPLSSLDKKLREEMQRELTRIHRETDLTIVHVTHNQTEALRMSDRIAVVRDGAIEQLAEKEALYSEPATPFVAGFVGNTNLFDGTVVASDDAGGTARVDGLDIAFGGSRAIPSSDPITIGVRAEKVQIADSLDTDVVLEGVVDQAIFEGDQIFYTVSVDGTDFEIVKQNAEDAELHRPQDAVSIGWDRRNTMVWP